MIWWNEFNFKKVSVLEDLTTAELVERSLNSKLASLSNKGSLVFNTGKFTGRAANDKYIVKDTYSSKVIDWSGNVNELSKDDFHHLKRCYIKEAKHYKELFVTEKS